MRTSPLGDTLWFCFLPSSLDASEALASPGVVDVITAQDVPGDNGREEEKGEEEETEENGNFNSGFRSGHTSLHSHQH